MKNRYTDDEIQDYYSIFSEGTVRVAMKSVIHSLKKQNLQLDEIPSSWGEQEPIYFVIPKIRDQYRLAGLESLSLGMGSIDFSEKSRTAWEGRDDESCSDPLLQRDRVIYKLIKDIPLDDSEMEICGKFCLKKEDFLLGEERRSILNKVSPRVLKWVGSFNAPYVVSINMVYAYGFDNIPEGLYDQIDEKRHDIADRLNLFLGHSSAVRAQCLGYGVSVDAFTSVPEDITQIDMCPLIKAIREIGDIVLKYKP